MLYFKLDSDGLVVGVAEKCLAPERDQWISRHDIKDLDHANRLAKEATELTGTLYFGLDNGSGVWPRFDVGVAPVVGAEVSYGFNGDYYPDGVITHVTAGTLRIVKTSTGSVYLRRKDSGNWRNGTWSLVPGHRDERNPSF